MFIKLDIQGELLDKLKEESENQFRSCTQQVMYIISKYYKDKENNILNNSNNNAYNTCNNEIISRDNNYTQDIGNAPKQDSSTTIETTTNHQQSDDYDYDVDDDIVNF